MKYLIIPALLLFVGSSSCRKSGTCNTTDKVYKGRVVNAICASVTIQFVDGTPMGERNWNSMPDGTGITYDHVFKLANPCDAGVSGEGDDTFNFKIVEATPQNCVQCMAVGYTPTKELAIKIVP